MWYKASSVVTAVLQCQKLFLDKGEKKPSCPKHGNNIHCSKDFPECEGKTKKCNQHLRFINESGAPATLHFDYYTSAEERDGLIKKQNSTLLLLIKKYEINEDLMVSA
jgi:hypothetical protein